MRWGKRTKEYFQLCSSDLSADLAASVVKFTPLISMKILKEEGREGIGVHQKKRHEVALYLSTKTIKYNT